MTVPFDSTQERRMYSGGETKWKYHSYWSLIMSCFPQACWLSEPFEHQLGSSKVSWQEGLQKRTNTGNCSSLRIASILCLIWSCFGSIENLCVPTRWTLGTSTARAWWPASAGFPPRPLVLPALLANMMTTNWNLFTKCKFEKKE